MPELPGGLRVATWEKPGLSPGARLPGRVRLVATAAAAIAATGAAATLLWPPRPILLWNASASSPIGLYAVAAPDDLDRGDRVIAWAPAWARSFAADRGYLPSNVPLVKRVAAVPGDRVCAAGEAIHVNGRLEVLRRLDDAQGRPLPWWTGCVDIAAGELFLLMPGSAGSFDGRYFGVTDRRDVVGEATLLWAR